MDKPRFVCGSYDVTIEQPFDYQLKPIQEINGDTTLDGTLREDTLYRKYKYVLIYESLSWTEYENLEDLLLYAVDNDLAITFTWPKWSQTVAGVSVNIKLPDRDKQGGSGTTGFYSKVTLEMVEINPR